ncbi:hypothetical protein ACIRG4_17670 [Streptomyces sp. NPDC102395]|uniref:hypothetical protein n=1 Tax=Streptomyces sp. NPDC102395 TaxID=3366168 RepID=UPI003821098F
MSSPTWTARTPDVADLDRSDVRHGQDPGPPPERLPDLLHRARVTDIGPGPPIESLDLHGRHHLLEGLAVGNCAMTSTASSSTTTPYRIPHTPV